VGDEVFYLLAGGFAEGLGAAEIDGVGLDQSGIELVQADELAEAVANFPFVRCKESSFACGGDGRDSGEEPNSSTEQMPMP